MSLVEPQIQSAFFALTAGFDSRRFARRDVDEDALVEVAPPELLLLIRRRTNVEATIGSGSEDRRVEEDEWEEVVEEESKVGMRKDQRS